MFKKLHSLNEDSSTSLNPKKKQEVTYRKNFIKHNTEHKRNSSYGQKFRKKNNLLPNVPELQIVQTDTFLFQGRLASVVQGSSLTSSQTEKHGQGVMFLKNGTLIIGFWDHGFLHGRALIFTPFGGKTIAQFYNGKLNGWAITLFSQKLVVCAAYYDNRIDGEKIIYEANQQMWVGSKYVKQTDSFKIIHLQKGKINELPQFLKMSIIDELVELYDDFINNQSCCILLKEIQFIPLAPNLTYIGYCNQDGNPEGLGAIYGKRQFYLGYFREGSLECYGRMIFQNGQIYHGQLLSGVFYGHGVYYNPAKNMSTIMLTNRDEQKILDEQEGYICINSSLSYFKYNKHSQSGMLGDPLNSMSEIIQKYYSRYFIEKKGFPVDKCTVNSEFGVSQNNQDGDLFVSQAEEDKRKKKEGQKMNRQAKDPKQKWLNFNQNEQSRMQQSSYEESAHNQSQINFQRVYSLDKRETAYNRKHLAEQSIPVNLKDNAGHSRNDQRGLEAEMNKLRLDRNFSLKQRGYNNLNSLQSIKIKQNVRPEQLEQFKKKRTQNISDMTLSFNKNSTLSPNDKKEKNSSLDVLTFRNQEGIQESGQQISAIKNQRKYSHMIESQTKFSPQDSVISDLSHKVEGLVRKSSTKRKRIFM